MRKIQAQLLLLCTLLTSAVTANELFHDPADSTEGHFILMPSSSRSKLYSLTHHHDHESGPLSLSNIKSKKANLKIRKIGNDIDGKCSKLKNKHYVFCSSEDVPCAINERTVCTLGFFSF